MFSQQTCRGVTSRLGWSRLFIGLFLALFACGSVAAEPKRAYGIETRVPWTTSRVVGSPDPPSPYVTELAFPNLELKLPLLITAAPGTDRLFVASRFRTAWSFPNDPEVSEADVFVDLGGWWNKEHEAEWHNEIFGMAFHPDFEKNRYVYFYLPQKEIKPSRMRVSRFEVSLETHLKSDVAPKIDLDTQHIILEFPANGHNGGCLKFGPDGYFYIGVGDGGGSNDTNLTGQYLGDFLSSILRIDVNGRHSAKSYAIPPDNPFINVAGVTPEVYAYGFRQPWRFSFDRKTGDLWVGDVGQDLWEMVYLVESGGNYGWSINEGPQAFRPHRERGPTPIRPPVVSHGHDESRSVTGGYVYRGQSLPKLYGAYIYADYETGKIWGLRYGSDAADPNGGEKVTWHEELDDTTLGIASFGEDHDGELYFVSHQQGRIHRLSPRPPSPPKSTEFPRRLSETGLFASVKDHQVASGLIPYSVNYPFWSDYATKERFIALPPEANVEYKPDNPWVFPEGSVLVKTFHMEMARGDPSSRRRLETRLLTLQDGQWAGYTYLWNDEQTDATLIGKRGLRKTYTIRDSSAPGGKREQTWHYPSRAECMICHNEKGRFVLGLSTAQLNRDHDYGEVADNQIRTLEHLGLFTESLPGPPSELPRLTEPGDSKASLETRARSYLHANCSHCHRYKGGGNSDFVLLYHTSLKETQTVNIDPLHGNLGVRGAKLIKPGKPEFSLIYHRIANPGPGHMPHIGSLELDHAGIDLVREWITAMPVQASTGAD